MAIARWPTRWDDSHVYPFDPKYRLWFEFVPKRRRRGSVALSGSPWKPVGAPDGSDRKLTVPSREGYEEVGERKLLPVCHSHDDEYI